jgi:outer membrane protein
MKIRMIAVLVAIFATLAASAQTTPAAPKIGWTNVDYVLNVLPDSKKIQNEIQIQQQQIEKALQEKQKELQDLYAAYQKNANTWSEIIRADKEKQIQTRQQELQEFQQSSQETLQKKYQTLVQPVLGKIDEAVKAVGKENGFTYILNFDAGANSTPLILYSGVEENNVTNLVLKKMGVDPAQIEKEQKDAAQKAADALKKQTTPAPAATPAPKKN